MVKPETHSKRTKANDPAFMSVPSISGLIPSKHLSAEEEAKLAFENIAAGGVTECLPPAIANGSGQIFRGL
jgi:hypothetical protein